MGGGIEILIESLWLSLPLYVANMTPVFIKGVSLFSAPIDLGHTFGGKPIFGPHKTYRGLFFGTLGAIATVYLQLVLVEHYELVREYSLIAYADVSWFVLGALFGAGALCGDLVESFFKRRVNIKSGRSWLFFDQIDYVIGGLVFLSIIFIPSFVHMMSMMALGVALSFGASFVGYYLGLKHSRV